MGFLTVGRRFLNNPHDIIDDRIDVLTRGTMALTVTCARCHDHKYDPIPTKDYYSLYGVLASSVEPAEPADLMTLADAEQPVEPHVFVRGNPGNRGESVPRQFLSRAGRREPPAVRPRQRPAGTGPRDRQPRQSADGPRDRQSRLAALFRRSRWCARPATLACAASRPAIPNCSTIWPRR